MFGRFKNKKIAVIGAGTEGLSSALFLAKRGAIVSVLDQKKEEQLDQGFIKILREKDIKILGGEGYLKNLKDFDLIIRSPGVNLKRLKTKDLRHRNITSQTKLFFDLCPCPIIGVTGTKGKGTTSVLIYEMLQKQSSFAKASGEKGFNVYLGGNIGRPPLDFLDKLNTHSKVILELSSFQLQDITKSPHIAVMLMTTSEHLDYHKDTKEYIDAKRNILKFQTASDAAILNKDYPASNESDTHTQAKVYKVSRSTDVMEGCFVQDGKIVLKVASTIEEIIDTREILIPGEHNFENVCAAVMASYLAGATKANMVKVLKTFKGLEHRLELVGEISGVRYYDDSFSTTPETAIAAIAAFSEPEIIVLGGASKGSNFKELGEVISGARNIKAIIGIGKEWKRIKAQFRIQPIRQAQGKNSKFKIIENCKNMHEIVKAASGVAKSGDVVLLSPACASFDMFKNYKDRGDLFKEEVSKLPTRN